MDPLALPPTCFRTFCFLELAPTLESLWACGLLSPSCRLPWISVYILLILGYLPMVCLTGSVPMLSMFLYVFRRSKH
jgi:hypothetical protein